MDASLNSPPHSSLNSIQTSSPRFRLLYEQRTLKLALPAVCLTIAHTTAVLLLLILSLILSSCATLNQREFNLAEDEDALKARPRPIYLTGTKPIETLDSAARAHVFLDIWKVENEDYPREIRLFARVMDSAGNFIANMAEPYYKGEGDYRRIWTRLVQILGGDTVEVKTFSVREYGDADSVAYALGLTLDHGGSMAGTIGILQEAARMFTRMKYPQDRLGIVKFDSKVHLEVPLTADSLALERGLQSSDLNGYGLYTALYDAIKATILAIAPDTTRGTAFSGAPNRALRDTLPRALVVFTDGEDNHSTTTAQEVYRLARRYNIRLFPVGFGYLNDDVLRDLAAFTGGRYYKVYSKQELSAVFQDIYKGLRNFYKITYTPDEYAGEHKVEITINLSNYNDSTNRLTRRFGIKTDTADSTDNAGSRSGTSTDSARSLTATTATGALLATTPSGDGHGNNTGNNNSGNKLGNSGDGTGNNSGDGRGNNTGNNGSGNNNSANKSRNAGDGTGSNSGDGRGNNTGNNSSGNNNSANKSRNAGDGTGNNSGDGRGNNTGNNNSGNKLGNSGDGTGSNSGDGRGNNTGNNSSGNNNSANKSSSSGDGRGNNTGNNSSGNNNSANKSRNAGDGTGSNTGDGRGNNTGNNSSGNNNSANKSSSSGDGTGNNTGDEGGGNTSNNTGNSNLSNGGDNSADTTMIRRASISFEQSGITPFDSSAFTRNILFEFRKADIRPESEPILNDIVRALRRYTSVRLDIRGHTDNVGTAAFNQTLSELRAQAVRDALIAKGIAPERLTWRGFGMSMPVAPNDTEENRQKNRRTEFGILRR
jgi:VWFA-related protein